MGCVFPVGIDDVHGFLCVWLVVSCYRDVVLSSDVLCCWSVLALRTRMLLRWAVSVGVCAVTIADVVLQVVQTA